MQSYDEVYARPEFYWGRQENRLVQQAVELVTKVDSRGSVAVDLGCGEGRDMIYLAKRGFTVSGIDISAPGLRKAEHWAMEEGLDVATMQADITGFRLHTMHDLVYSSGTLTFLPAHIRSEVFENYKYHTVAGGVHAFNVFVEKPFLETPPDWGTEEHYYRSGELLGYYWDWEILRSDEVIFDCNSSGIPHRHAMDVVIARKC